jgi:hypothetical protein
MQSRELTQSIKRRPVVRFTINVALAYLTWRLVLQQLEKAEGEVEAVKTDQPSQNQAASDDKQEEKITFIPTGFPFLRYALIPLKGSPEMDALDRFSASPKLRKDLNSNEEPCPFQSKPDSVDDRDGR